MRLRGASQRTAQTYAGAALWLGLNVDTSRKRQPDYFPLWVVYVQVALPRHSVALPYVCAVDQDLPLSNILMLCSMLCSMLVSTQLRQGANQAIRGGACQPEAEGGSKRGLHRQHAGDDRHNQCFCA